MIIEEAAKAWPTELAMALTWGNRWTLIGDHKQLPAFGKEEVASVLADLAELRDKPELRLHGRRRDAYLEVFDLFPRLFETDRKEKTESTKPPPAPGWSGYAAKPVARLTRQFRMRSDIANLVSEVFYAEKNIEEQEVKYKGGLETDPSTDKRELPIALPPWLREGALHWIDTGPYSRGLAPEDKPHWHNPSEVAVVKQLLSRLEKENSGDKKQGLANHLSILSPYLRQVEKLRNSAGSGFSICVDTVDAFQGREANIVIVSIVRCNEHKNPRLGGKRVPTTDQRRAEDTGERHPSARQSRYQGRRRQPSAPCRFWVYRRQQTGENILRLRRIFVQLQGAMTGA